MSEIKGNKKIIGKINAKTLRATTNIPEWLQPLIKEENGVYVGTEPPTDPNKLVWINPDGQASEVYYTISEINAMLEEYAKKDIVPTIYVKDASITNDILNIIKSDGTSLSFAGGSATSPTIETEEVENGYKLIITDFKGTKEVIISNGEQGPQGLPGKDGTDGLPGQPGADGFSPIATVESNSDGAVITITDKNGTTTSQIYNGSNGLPGADGLDGQDGFSPTVEVTDTETGVLLTITDVNGAKTATINDGPVGPQGQPGADGHTPVKGVDYFTQQEKNEIITEAASAVNVPVATTETAGKVKPDGTTITVDEDGTIHSVGGGGGSVSIDNKTIVQNEDGTIGTSIGGCWADGLVDGPEIVNFNGKTSKDVSSILTYDVMMELISYGDRLRANLSTGFGTESGCLVDIDTSTAGTYKLRCFYTISSVKCVYTGVGDSTNWNCTRNFEGGGAGYNSSNNSFYYMVDGKVPVPITNAKFIPIDNDTLTVSDNKIITNIVKRGNGENSLIFSCDVPTAIAEGRGAVSINGDARGSQAVSFGGNALGSNSISYGNQTNAYGSYSLCGGYIAQTRADRQLVFGYFSNWNKYGNDAKNSLCFGNDNGVYSPNSVAYGKYCLADTSKQYSTIVGNGNSNTDRANIYTLDWSGNATFAGTVSSTGADYAEFFEWKDGNTESEDRVGYIVTLDGDKIKLASDGEDILGVISATATVLGDNAEWCWNKRYLTDDFGRTLYEDREVTHEAAYNDDGEKIADEWTEVVHAPVINPAYDPDKPYINRRNRPEWSAVGMMGKLYVRDDGTAQVNGYVTAKNGIATHSDSKTNMRVMKRVKDNIILVCLK